MSIQSTPAAVAASSTRKVLSRNDSTPRSAGSSWLAAGVDVRRPAEHGGAERPPCPTRPAHPPFRGTAKIGSVTGPIVPAAAGRVRRGFSCARA